ncbi:capsule assembly Wzi family protein, partial [Sediminibacterium sp.]|uniref:capsule assembly Wzi family protein n=1 Tax=Sediminibacterium sp. TaxID=1917865 RepID=UPI003F72D850
MVRTIQLTGMLVLCFAIHTIASAQQGLLQQTQIQDYYRRLQLAGDSSIKSSFHVQPYQARSKQDLFRQKKDTFLFQSVVGITIQNNSALPYGYNDENLYPAIGLQQRVTVGARFETKDLLIQIQPEWVNAANTTGKPLLPPAMNNLGNYYARYFAMLGNRIDMPLYFGEQKLSTVYAGQSALKYKFAGFAAGISTENVWWGPARYNALIMGNNAPGFLHATLNTTTPFSTPIGEFEAQVVVGEMEASGITPPEFERMSQLGCPQCYEAPPAGKKRRMT